MYRDARAKAKKRRIVCLEWDGRSLRVVEATVSRKGASLEKVVSLLIPAEVDLADASAMGQWIRRALEEQGISAKLAVVDVPRNQAILTTLNLPTVVERELPGMVEFQIAKELPFPVSEAVVDFAVPNNVTEKTAPVLVAAVRNEVVEHLKSVVTHAGLKVERVGLRPFASKTAVCRLLGETMPERVLFVDVGPTLTEIDVITADSVPFSRAADVLVPGDAGEPRTIKLGPTGEPPETTGDALTLPLFSVEAVVESLVLEVTRSVEAYRARERGQRISHAIIAGSMGIEEALQEALQHRFDFTVEVYNPASTFGWSAEEGASACGFASVFGLVLSHDADPSRHFDFLHPKKTVTQTEVRLRKAPRLIGWAAAIIVTLMMGYWTTIRDDLETKAKLQKQIDEMLADRDEKEQFIKLVKQVKDFDDQQVRWLDEFGALVMQFPGNQEFVLNEVRMEGADRKILADARFPEKGELGWELPHELKHKLESLIRPGATRPHYEVDLQLRGENPGNSKYGLKQAISFYLRDDGYTPETAKAEGSSKPGGDTSAPPSSGKPAHDRRAKPPEGAAQPPAEPKSEPPTGEPGPGEPPTDKKTDPTPNGAGKESGGGAEKPVPAPKTPPRTVPLTRTPATGGASKSGQPAQGVKTDARGRPIPAAGVGTAGASTTGASSAGAGKPEADPAKSEAGADSAQPDADGDQAAPAANPSSGEKKEDSDKPKA
ncbi:MAG: pilus assembly protein PilM [Phycisphaerales bacterium]|nr:pilus assembly protein PilM [Phycisphaerales bacterium]